MNNKNKHKFTQKIENTLPKKVASNKATKAVLEVADRVEEHAEKTLHSITDFLGSVRSVAQVVGPEAVKRTKQKLETLMLNMDAVLQTVDSYTNKKSTKTASKTKKTSTASSPRAKKAGTAQKVKKATKKPTQAKVTKSTTTSSATPVAKKEAPPKK